eukprot:1902793-Prymnesium_polylepis.1
MAQGVEKRWGWAHNRRPCRFAGRWRRARNLRRGSRCSASTRAGTMSRVLRRQTPRRCMTRTRCHATQPHPHGDGR